MQGIHGAVLFVCWEHALCVSLQSRGTVLLRALVPGQVANGALG